MCLYTGKPNGKSGEIAGTSHSFNDKIFRIQTFETCYSLATFKFSQSVAAFLINSTECCCISKPDLFDRQLCLVLVVVMMTIMEVTMMMNVNDNGDDDDKDDCDDDNYN